MFNSLKTLYKKINLPVKCLIILVFSGVGLTAQNNPPAPQLTLEPCRLNGWNEDVRCGKYEVFEDRKTKKGRRIALRLVVVPASGENVSPDPIFYFSGGPGGSAVETITRAGKNFLADLRRQHDLVFVDQRGTGGSNPLGCNLYGDKNDMAAYFGDVIPLEKLRACRHELEKIADLKLYSTVMAMEDIDEVRAALGYEKINLYGGSYGSTAALVYLRQFPRHVRTVTISGVAPPDMKLPLPVSKGVQNALEKVFTDCRADNQCRASFPNLKTDFTSILKALAKAPVTFETVNPFTKQPQQITLKREVFGEFVRTMLYDTAFSRWLPLALHRAAAGDFTLFATISFQSFRTIEDLIARGMHFSVVCGEDLPFITNAEIKRETAGYFYSDYRLRGYREACRNWSFAKIPRSFLEPVKSDLPVLLISGEADPVTPPWLATRAAKFLSRSRQVIVPHAGHAVSSPCVNELIENFIRGADVKALDVSCISKTPPPVFVTEQMITANRPETPSSKHNEKIWQGILETGEKKLRIVLHLFQAKDGKLSALLESPDQGEGEIPVDIVRVNGDILHFEITLLSAVYEGRFNADKTEINGQWQQGAGRAPLIFHVQK